MDLEGQFQTKYDWAALIAHVVWLHFTFQLACATEAHELYLESSWQKPLTVLGKANSNPKQFSSSQMNSKFSLCV